MKARGTKGKKQERVEAVKRELEELFDEFYRRSVKEPRSLKRLRRQLAELGVDAGYEICISYRSGKKRGRVDSISVRPNHDDHKLLKEMGVRWSAVKSPAKRKRS